ncbi:MAG: TatD family hydrolase [Ginsengibacter sp.]
MTLIDTHTHLYLNDFAGDIQTVIDKALSAGVKKFYLPSIDSTEMNNMLELERKYPECFSMMALHPCSVKANYKEELSIVQSWLGKRKFVAIGETGLDFYWDQTFKEAQYECFNTHLEWALEYHLPVVLHTRNAMRETIDVVKKYTYRGLQGIFHCFSGSLAEAKEIIDAGFLLGIGGVVTYKNAGLAEVIKEIDMQYIVLETDAPYLTPVPFRGKRNESSYLPLIVQKLASLKNISEEEVALITTANAERIFKTSP